jgi:hypothetical protein
MTDPPASHDFLYVHTDIPPGMTIRAWRAQRAATPPGGQRSPRFAGGCHARAAPRGAPEPRTQSMTTGSVYLPHFDPGLPVSGDRVTRR